MRVCFRTWRNMFRVQQNSASFQMKTERNTLFHDDEEDFVGSANSSLHSSMRWKLMKGNRRFILLPIPDNWRENSQSDCVERP